MTIEVMSILTGVSILFAIYSGFVNLKRDKSRDDKSDAAQLTTVIVKLESISQGISEIKNDMNNVKTEQQSLRDRIVVVEESSKSAHKRIDTMERKEVIG